jgi:hypothetical protein
MAYDCVLQKAFTSETCSDMIYYLSGGAAIMTTFTLGTVTPSNSLAGATVMQWTDFGDYWVFTVAQTETVNFAVTYPGQANYDLETQAGALIAGGEPLSYVLGPGTYDLVVFYNEVAGQPINTQASYGLTITATVSHVAPTVYAVSTVSVAENAPIVASSLITSVSNPSNDNITMYGFYDSGGGTGHFTLNGIAQPDNTWVDVTTANLNTVQYVGGTSTGTDTLLADVFDATTGTWSANSSPITATTTAPAHIAPTVNATNFSIAENASISGPFSFITFTNPSGDSITQYAYWDGGTGNGHFTLNGIIQPDGQWVYVNAANVNTISYVGGPNVGSETLSFSLFDATTGTWSTTVSFTATTTAPVHIAPTVYAVSTVSVAENQSIAGSSLIASISNPSGDSITLDIFKDDGGGTGYFTLNGVHQANGQWIYPLTTDNVQYVGGSSPGTDHLEVGVYDYTTNSYSIASTTVAATTTGSQTETITYPGSGLVFVNTYAANDAGYRSAIIAAEHDLQSHFTATATLNIKFDLQDLSTQPNDPAAENVSNDMLQHVSYDSLKSALQTFAHDIFTLLPTSDPTNGQGFVVPIGLAQVLHLAGPDTGIDDTVTLNSTLPWGTYQNAIGTIEHEISEQAMGRIGSLGFTFGGQWGPTDLFRYSPSHTYDDSGNPDFFSADGGVSLSSQQFAAFGNGDLADWDNTSGDAFGPGGPGSPGTLSATDLQVMEALGWTPTAPAHIAPTVYAVSTVSVAENQSIAGSSLIANISNPSGDHITQYIFLDEGGGTGYFTFNGVHQPDGQWIYPNDSSAIQGSSSVQYVGGSSPGTDTLEVGIYDNTTNSYSYSTAIAATTTASLSLIIAQTIQNDYLGITRTALSLTDATTEANAINAGTTTEFAFMNSLFVQVAHTTMPVVAVEGSMYGAVGSSAVITSLVNNFLPGQIAYANQVGADPELWACSKLALVFAFSNETGSTAFANNFGPSNVAMPATAAGDSAFATAATNAIFGSAQTANTEPAILGYVHYLEGFFATYGIAGVQNPTADQIVIAARAGAWGDGVAIALENTLGPLLAQTIDFIDDAAQGTAIYSASFASQPTPALFQGQPTTSATVSHVQVTGVAAPIDHIVM